MDKKLVDLVNFIENIVIKEKRPVRWNEINDKFNWNPNIIKQISERACKLKIINKYSKDGRPLYTIGSQAQSFEKIIKTWAKSEKVLLKFLDNKLLSKGFITEKDIFEYMKIVKQTKKYSISIEDVIEFLKATDLMFLLTGKPEIKLKLYIKDYKNRRASGKLGTMTILDRDYMKRKGIMSPL